LFVIGVLILPGAASAGTLERVGSELRYQAAPGDLTAVLLTVTDDSTALDVRGWEAHLAAGSGCTQEQPPHPAEETEVRCPIGGVTRISFQLGDDWDFVGSNLPAAAPPLWVHGGDGPDSVSYLNFASTTGVALSLDGVANDGFPHQGDNIGSDVENVEGSEGPDRLVGTPGPNDFSGGNGQDLIEVGAGDDRVDATESVECPPHSTDCSAAESDDISCGPGYDRVEADKTDSVGRDCELVAVDSRIDLTNGPDRFTLYRSSLSVYGHRGNDVITAFAAPSGTIALDRVDGGRGNDVLNGRNLEDTLTGGPGRDRISGGKARDTIRVRDGQRDVVACGRGWDTVFADRKDRVSKDCEKVRRRRA
jgi:Ca2+-binding RTX toxin-like protein